MSEAAHRHPVKGIALDGQDFMTGDIKGPSAYFAIGGLQGRLTMDGHARPNSFGSQLSPGLALLLMLDQFNLPGHDCGIAASVKSEDGTRIGFRPHFTTTEVLSTQSGLRRQAD